MNTNDTVPMDIICRTFGQMDECEVYFQAQLQYYSYSYYLIDYLERDTPNVFVEQQNCTYKQKKHLFYKNSVNNNIDKLEI